MSLKQKLKLEFHLCCCRWWCAVSQIEDQTADDEGSQ